MMLQLVDVTASERKRVGRHGVPEDTPAIFAASRTVTRSSPSSSSRRSVASISASRRFP